jgi:hypothetical protein
VRDFNPDVEELIARALRANVYRRWQSAEQMADKIAQATDAARLARVRAQRRKPPESPLRQRSREHGLAQRPGRADPRGGLVATRSSIGA